MAIPLRVLIVDDSPDDAELLVHEIRKGGYCETSKRVDTAGAMRTALEETGWDLIISDYSLPGFGGRQALTIAQEKAMDVPVIVVSGTVGEDLAVGMMRAGAHDYLMKDRLARLPSAIKTALDHTQERQKRQKAEERVQLAGEVFAVLGGPPQRMTDTVREILRLIQEHTDFEAAGIRLREGDDFPYYEARGFSEEFLQAERFLCERNGAGEAVRDANGDPVLECMCGNVLRGRTDPMQPFFTEAGSFWTNGTTRLLASTTEKERMARTRNRCNGEGYESVALIPLRSGDEIVGLLQFNDHRPNRFTVEMIQFFESLGGSIGIALGHKRAEEALAGSEAMLRAILDATKESIWLFSADGVILMGNETALSRAGKPPTEIIGKHFNEVHSPEQARSRLARLREAVESGRPVEFEDERSGIEFHHGFYPVLDAQGRSTRVVSLSRDITEHKRAEAAREKLEEQFRTSQKLEAIGSLAGGVAHDFNNLLCVILSYSDFALESVREGDPLRDDLLEVKRAGERAAALTQQLLAFGRRQMLRPQPLDLNRVIAELEKMLRRIIGEDIDLVQVLAPDLGLTLADPGQIEQMVMNLVVNSRDAMAAGGKLTIETANVDLDEEDARQHVAMKPGPYVLLAVSDTGCGMDAQTRARIFEPFFTTKEEGKGTGLGLSTVYGIVKQSGGNVWVYSEPGHGTTFKVYLPRELSAGAPAPRIPAAVTRTMGTETILVVEDGDAIRNLAARILGSAGYTVLTAANGGEALLTCEGHPGTIHLLLTDVVMPKMSGTALAERLAVVRPGIKVLYMSGYTDNVTFHHGLLDLRSQFIGKPFNAADLARKVREVLDEERSGTLWDA